jgi:NhaA family Na+:H+ antiporter
MFGVVPLFGFASAGVTIGGGSSLFSTLSIAIALGLFLGKQVGVVGAVWLADRTGFARKPSELSWLHMYAAALLCGIGFTMSLFIGDLAFDDGSLVDAAKIGTLAGSMLAVMAAIIVLRLAPPCVPAVSEQDEADEIFGENFDEEPQLDET